MNVEHLSQSRSSFHQLGERSSYQILRSEREENKRTNLPNHVQCPTDKRWLMHIKGLKCPFDESRYTRERFVGFDSLEHEVQPHRLFGRGDQPLIEDRFVKGAVESVGYTLRIRQVYLGSDN